MDVQLFCLSKCPSPLTATLVDTVTVMIRVKTSKTRMHSSRMHTVRCSGHLRVSARQGWCLPEEEVSAWGLCLPEGAGGVGLGGSLPRG